MRIYRISNNTRIGPIIFAESEADAIDVAVAAGRIRNPAKAKATDVTDSFAHPREKTERALAAGIKGVAAYRLNSADSPAARLAMTMMGAGLSDVAAPSGWIINGQFVE